ncbi:MAG: diaminopimelate epimerase [Candidatus Omnitrophota bacterium]|nr:diaminopimelate epimerase [Candidatus Omnitrophota bacterium]
MKKKKILVEFRKIVAAGNDFIVIDQRRIKTKSCDYKNLAKKMCNRTYGIGADGLLVLSASRIADATMRIFNADGSEAEMCGNGARCAAYVIAHSAGTPHRRTITFETLAGIIRAHVRGTLVRIGLTEPATIQLNIPVTPGKKKFHAHFINTGVPHVVIPVNDIDDADLGTIGRRIRYHSHFAPGGTNVNFLKIIRNNHIAVRTYERGVEAETLACGTGAAASALITSCITKRPLCAQIITVITKSSEIIKVYFTKTSPRQFTKVYLEGDIRHVCTGGYYV